MRKCSRDLMARWILFLYDRPATCTSIERTRKYYCLSTFCVKGVPTVDKVCFCKEFSRSDGAHIACVNWPNKRNRKLCTVCVCFQSPNALINMRTVPKQTKTLKQTHFICRANTRLDLEIY